MRSIVKWAATTLSRISKKDTVATQQVEYMGKSAKVTTWTMFGFDNAPPPGKLALLFSILGNSDNQVGIVGSPGERPLALKEGEVVMFHPESGSRVHMLEDGIIRLQASGVNPASIILNPLNGNIVISPGFGDTVRIAGKLDVDGDLNVDGATTLGATVTSNGKDISDTHKHLIGTIVDSTFSACFGQTGTTV